MRLYCSKLSVFYPALTVPAFLSFTARDALWRLCLSLMPFGS